ncbi:hypothetical protein [Devosia sp.]|uniref:hypothetical protein n=1 Tax=Devosia sp. TaxID=1871048 RepID=UPI002AFF6EB3|nr:hypothetical protein [Devosia sp.]
MLRVFTEQSEPEDGPAMPFDRIACLDARYQAQKERLTALCDLGVTGLGRMVLPDLHFPHTMRSRANRDGSGARPEGDNLRYAIIVALGLAWTPEPMQRDMLGGKTAADLALRCAARAARSREPGAVALAAWAAAETAGVFSTELFEMLQDMLTHDRTVQTVPCAWMLTAALAARHLGSTAEVQDLASQFLLEAQAETGLFPHTIPASALGRARSHIACFADQVYPIQALARLGRAEGDRMALRAAEASAARIVALQGHAGQWWWHYDTRDGSVVEGYPVYSVHQHAMAPMALLDLHAAGGSDYRPAVLKGLDWIDTHPESSERLVSPEGGVIWRKIGRREPPKLVRSVLSLTTALAQGWHLPGLDMAFPPISIDRECRPYEFGWMLYAWRSRGVVEALG